jgi:hypothetical protein
MATLKQSDRCQGTHRCLMVRVRGGEADTVPNAVLRLTNDVRPIFIRSDENGAFVAELEAGVYCIEDVRDTTNKKLRRIEDQARCFRIVPGRRTHFDIHVRAK